MGGTAMSGDSDHDRLPGSRLYRLSKAVCDDETLRSLVTPTLADLQHEVALADQRRARRWFAYLRGCAGLCRVLIVQLMTGRFPMRRWSVVLTLGIVGAALLIAPSFLTGVSLFTKGPVQVAPFFLMAIVAPVVLRRLKLGATFPQMFVSCATVGTTMGGVFMAWLLWVVIRQPLPWYVLARGVAILLGSVVLGSALAAAVAAERTGDGRPRVRIDLRRLVWSAAAFGVSYTVLQLRFVVYNAARVSVAESAGYAIQIVCWAAFLAFFFSAVAATVYYPLILALRRLSANRLLPTVLGALLFPIPWEVYAFVRQDPRLHVLNMLNPNSMIPVVLLFLPLVIGGAVFGWGLANRNKRPDAVGHLEGAATM
jgi:hypothetical protein